MSEAARKEWVLSVIHVFVQSFYNNSSISFPRLFSRYRHLTVAGYRSRLTHYAQ